MSARTGLLFLGAPAVPEMVSISQRAEAAGFESAWVAETRLTRDAIAPAAAIALGTERLRVGTGIVNVYTRNAVLLALTFATLDEIAPGRIVMGLGAGSPLVLAPQGIAFDRPLTRLREYCEVIPRLLAGETVTYTGDYVQLDAARIEAGSGSYLTLGPGGGFGGGIVECGTVRPLWLPYVQVISAPQCGELAIWQPKP